MLRSKVHFKSRVVSTTGTGGGLLIAAQACEHAAVNCLAAAGGGVCGGSVWSTGRGACCSVSSSGCDGGRGASPRRVGATLAAMDRVCSACSRCAAACHVQGGVLACLQAQCLCGPFCGGCGSCVVCCFKLLLCAAYQHQHMLNASCRTYAHFVIGLSVCSARVLTWAEKQQWLQVWRLQQQQRA